MEKQEQVKKFWGIYDRFISTKDFELMKELSDLLSEIEKPSKTNQLFRPEKNWNKILAWIVLRSERFWFPNGLNFNLMIGEIIAWCPPYDRDIFLTRIPLEEHVSGFAFLKIGEDFSGEDYQYNNFTQKHSENEFDQMLLYTGQANQKGLYLPIYERQILIEFVDLFFKKAKENSLGKLESDILKF